MTRPKRKSWAERHAQSLRDKGQTQAIKRIADRSEAEFQSQVATVRLHLLLANDGEDATKLLAMLSVVIGTPCIFGALAYGRPQWVRQLHGALRTIQTMCLDGYHWQAQYALAMDNAVELAAGQDIRELTPSMRKHFEQAWLDANYFASAIHQHQVTKDTVSDG